MGILVFSHNGAPFQVVPQIFEFCQSNISSGLEIFNTGSFLHRLTWFVLKSKKRFIVEYCDWSHLKEFSLEQITLEFHWFRKIISQWNCPITEKAISRLFFISKITREHINVFKRFWYRWMCFRIMHIVSKFQFFIHIFTVLKLKNENQTFNNGEKWAFSISFLSVCPVGLSQPEKLYSFVSTLRCCCLTWFY